MKRDFKADVIALLKNHWCEDKDNTGQIVIYTGLMRDQNDNIVAWKDPCGDED